MNLILNIFNNLISCYYNQIYLELFFFNSYISINEKIENKLYEIIIKNRTYLN